MLSNFNKLANVPKELLANTLNATNDVRAGNTDAKKVLRKSISTLDALYWQRTEELCIAAINSSADGFILNSEERLIVDAGILSFDLLNTDAHDIKDSISDDLNCKSENILYFSQWLSARLEHIASIQTAELSDADDSSNATIQDKEISLLRKKRNQAYAQLSHLFMKLPGISEQVSELIGTGKLDDQLTTMMIEHGKTKSADLREKMQKMQKLYLTVFTRVRNAANTQQEINLLDILFTLRKKVFEHSIIGVSEEEVSEVSVVVADNELRKSREDFLRTEIRMVRSLVRIGAMNAGLSKATSVLLQNQQRTTKPHVEAILERVCEIDPNLPTLPNVLIAPFTGSGFFEWDHDTLVVALTPAVSGPESVASAVGNYRILIDNFQHSSQIKNEYLETAKVEEKTYRAQFLFDYKDWVVNCAAGKEATMTNEAYNFFRKVIGPNLRDNPMPHELRHLSVRERNEIADNCEAKIEKQTATSQDYYYLASMNWARGQIDSAITNMRQVSSLSPTDAKIMYSLGLLMLSKTGLQSIHYLRSCLNNNPPTLWNTLAREEITRIESQ